MITQRTYPLTGKTVYIVFAGTAAGNMSPKYSDDAAQNEHSALKEAGAEALSLTRMNAKGGADLGVVEQAKEWFDGDALVTHQTDHVLSLFPADCIPLVLWDEAGKALSLVHLGRQGAGLGLATKAVQELGTEPNSLRGWIGPSIRKSSYFFDKPSYDERFDETWKEFTQEKGGLFYVDLTEYVLHQLEQAGVPRGNIVIEDIDTGADPRYFSHFRSKTHDQQEGRNGIFTWIA